MRSAIKYGCAFPPFTYPHVANEFLVAHRFIGLIYGRRALRAQSIAVTRVAAAIIASAHIADSNCTLGRAAGTLK